MSCILRIYVPFLYADNIVEATHVHALKELEKNNMMNSVPSDETTWKIIFLWKFLEIHFLCRQNPCMVVPPNM